MKYTISYSNPLTHLIDITLEIDHIKEAVVYLQLPSWRPGRYEIANFAKNILRIEALNNKGDQLDIRKVTKDRWTVNTMGSGSIKIKYIYYAHQMDAGNSWLDEEQVYINFINCILSVEGRMEEPCIVDLNLPKDYQIACGLIQKEKHSLLATSYYQLVDSPMIASNKLDHYEYLVQGVVFHIWIQGNHLLDSVKMLQDFEQFTTTQINVIKEFPCTAYHFLLQLLPYKHYHGVEHQNSTVITLGSSEESNHAILYQALLGISSHELFHTWNVIRIRPEEILPYDFSKENYFDTGYVAEGFTTYYGNLFLVRSGVLDIEWYLINLNKMLKGHFENFGRANMSVTDASFDLWLDGYVASTPNRKVSIYNKGAIIALMLDLQIRVQSNHEKSLDDVIRILWQKYGETNIGYNSNSILEIIQGLEDYNWQSFFDGYVYGKIPIEELLSSLLAHFGCDLCKTSSDMKNESVLGFRVDGDHRIIKIQPKSIAEKYLSVGDNIKNLSEIEVLISNNEIIRLDIVRNYKKVSVELPSGTEQYFEYYQIYQKKNSSPSQQEALEKWLIGKRELLWI